jgi:hypothetical protein
MYHASGTSLILCAVWKKASRERERERGERREDGAKKRERKR